MNEEMMREHARKEFKAGITNAEQFVKYLRSLNVGYFDEEKARTAWMMRDSDLGVG